MPKTRSSSKSKLNAKLITQLPAVVFVGSAAVKGMSLGADGVMVFAAQAALYHYSPEQKPRLRLLLTTSRHDKAPKGYVHS